MAALNMRYGGNIVSLPEGANFSPGNFGTYRLKYRVNSSSVGELGLTTNTQAKNYCGLKMRIGGQICYIGRVSSTSYISGDTIDYHDSSRGSLASQSASVSEYLTSIATLPIDYHSSSMSTSTSMYTEVTSTEQIETRSYTQEVWTRSATGTTNSGSGNGTSSSDPGTGTVTNNTGSTVTTRTVKGQSLTNSSFKESITNGVTYYSYYTIENKLFNQTGTAYNGSYRQLASKEIVARGSWSQWNAHVGTTTSYRVAKATQYDTRNVSVLTTNTYQVSSTTQSNSNKTTQASNTTYNTNKFSQYTHHIKTSTRANAKSTTQTLAYYAKFSEPVSTKSETFGSYADRWTYYWTSCKKVTYNYYSTATIREYSTRSYTGTTYRSSITRSTTSVSETIHNMNV